MTDVIIFSITDGQVTSVAMPERDSEETILEDMREGFGLGFNFWLPMRDTLIVGKFISHRIYS